MCQSKRQTLNQQTDGYTVRGNIIINCKFQFIKLNCLSYPSLTIYTMAMYLQAFIIIDPMSN
jgi:hypothetical protein